MNLPPDLLLDKRLVDRHIRRGFLSRDVYEQHLADLQDARPRAHRMRIEVSSVGVGRVTREDDGETET